MKLVSDCCGVFEPDLHGRAQLALGVMAHGGDKPDGIAWLVKHHPELKDSQIVKLIGTTKETITKIRERTHWNISNISAKHPAMLGLCKQTDLDAAIEKAGGTPHVEEQVSDISELP